MKTNLTKQSGFTLIELVTVTVILGILAAVAVPKFVNLGVDARKSALKGLESSMRGANALIFARSATEGESAKATGIVTVAGVTSVATAYGFAATATALHSMLELSNNADYTLEAALSPADGYITLAKATTPANCSVTYTAATGTDVPPTYTVDNAGC